jgi:hypothetical protein
VDPIAQFSDRSWRLRHLYKITDKSSHLSLYKPNAVQQALHASTSKRKITLKARQFGITTDAVLRCFDTAIWHPNKTVCILAHKQDVLDKIFNIVKTAYKNLPEELRPALDRGGGSKYEMIFPELNSRVYTTLEVRGGTIHKLHVSEAAFIPKPRIDATLQAVPLDGEVEFETTPNGLNHFYDFWMESEDRYERFFFPWFFHQEYNIATSPLSLTEDEQRLVSYALGKYGLSLSHEQIAFRRYKIKELGPRIFQQEYPEDDQTCFLASGSNPFDAQKLKAKMAEAPTDFQTIDQIRIYEPFHKTKTYVIGADPAEGVRSDYSVAVCYCVEDKREVAFFRSNTLRPEEFAKVIYQMGKLYSRADRWPTVIPERNNHGHALILALQYLGYPSLWSDTDEQFGHRTTVLTRPLLIDTFIEAIDSGLFDIRSRETFSECLTLVDNNGKIEAEDGKHDDTVIAAALAVKLSLERLPKVNVYKNIDTMVLV